jgi:hypothetical protein
MKVYRLKADLSHVDDTGTDCAHYPPQPIVGLDTAILRAKPFDCPSSLFFDANFDVLGKIDLLVNDLAWPIISRRLYKTLLSCGDFAHRTLPVLLGDQSFLEERYDHQGRLNPNIPVNHDYLALHVQELPDLFDRQRSEFTIHPVFPDKVGMIKELILKDQAEYPPIFRLVERPTMLLINELVYEILSQGGFGGLEMVDLYALPFY